jgi:hypothetical protein
LSAADSPQEEGKPKRKLNFRRLLLNKCQEEFEKGDAAMLAVAEREAKRGQGGEEEEQVGCLLLIFLCVWEVAAAAVAVVCLRREFEKGDAAMLAVAEREAK